MADKIMKFKGEFDASQILASLKQIRQEAEKSGANNKLLGSFDKDLAKVEKLTTQYLAQIQKGFSNQSDVKAFARTLDQLENIYSVIAVRAEQFGNVANFSTQTEEIKKLNSKIKELSEKEGDLTKKAKEYIQTKGEELKLTKTEISQLQGAVKEADAYREKLDEITEAKKKAAQTKINKIAIDTEAGLAEYDKISGTGGNKATFSVAEKKVRDSSRESAVKGNAVNEIKAAAAANKEYNDILKDTMINGGTAADAVERFIEVMRHYKLELENADDIQEEFAQDMAAISSAAIANKDALPSGTKGSLTRAQNQLTNAEAINSTLTGESVTNLQNLVSNLVVTTNNLTTASTNAGNAAQEAANKAQGGLQKETQAMQGVISADREELVEKQKSIQAQEEFNQTFERISYGVKRLLSVGSAFREVRNIIKQTYNDVKQLDKSFAEIAMVTKYSVADMWSMYPQYQQMANELGQTTQSVVQASGLFYQQGLDTAEALKLTEDTMKLATLAGLDFKDATSQMTAALRAFHMEMDQGAHVTDVYAELAAHAAASVNDLSEAMSATAAIAHSAGMSFENTSAMLTTMVEATQEAPKNLGTAMKTIIARFTELKENVAGTADSEFDDLDYNKVDKALKSVGVSIKDANGQFRNLDEVFLELSEKWNDLDRNTQRYIATIAAGSRQQSRFIALMENYDRTIELIDVAQNSAGKSSEQFAKYQDTLEYKVTQLKNSWEALRMSFTDSDFFKGLVDQAGKLISSLSKMDKKQIVSIGVIGITLGKTIITNFVKSLKDGVGSLGNGIQSALDMAVQKLKPVNLPLNSLKFNEEGQIEELDQLKAKLQEIYGTKVQINDTNLQAAKSYLEQVNYIAQLREQLRNTNLSEDERRAKEIEIAKAMNDQRKAAANMNNAGLNPQKIHTGKERIDPDSYKGIALGGFKSAVSSAATAALVTAIGGGDVKTAIKAAGISGLTAAMPSMMSLLGKFIATPHGAIVTACVAVAAIAGYTLYKYFTKHVDTAVESAEKRLEEATKRAEEAQSKAEEARNDTNTKKNAVEELEKLQKEYRELNGKAIKTTEEQEKYSELVSQIKEQFPEIVTSYDEVTGKLQVQNDLWDGILEKEKESVKLAASKQLGLEYVAAGANYSQAKAQYELTDAQLNSQIITDETSSKIAGALKDNIDADTLINNLNKNGLDTKALGKNLSIKLDTEEGKRDLLEAIASFNSTTEALEEIGIKDADTKRKYITENNQSIQNQKKTNEEYIKNAEKIYKEQKQMALSQTIQDKYGTSAAVANFEAFMTQTGSGYLKNNSQAINSSNTILKQKGSNRNRNMAIGFSTGSYLGAAIGSIYDYFTSDNLATEWDELNDQEQEAFERLIEDEDLKESGESAREAWERIAKNGDLLADYEEKLTEYLQAIYEEEYVEKFDAIMKNNSELSQALEDLQNNFATLGEQQLKSNLEKIRNITNEASGGDEDLLNGIDEYLNQFTEKRNDIIDKIKTMLGGKVTQDLTQYGIDQLEAYEQRLQSVIDQYGVFNAQHYDQLINQITKQYQLTAEQSSSIFMTNWSDVSALTAEDFRHNWITTMKESGVESAEQIYDQMRPTLEKLGIIDITISNAAEVDEFFDSLQEKAKAAFGEKDTVISIINSQAQEGKLTLEEYYEAIEAIQTINPNANINDYLNIDENGKITANIGKIKQLYLEQVAYQKQQLELQKQKTLEEYNQLKDKGYIYDAELEEIDATLTSLEAQEQKTNELNAQVDALNAQIDAYNQLNGTSYSHVSKAETDTFRVKYDSANVRKEIQKQGEDLREERLEQLKQALAEYDIKLSELENLNEAYLNDWNEEEKAIIDSLTDALQEATEEEIKALKELKKAQEDVIEKQKELNKAVYGDDNRTNKNGGLYNYITNYERYKTLADRSKEKFEDLQPGDDAKELLDEYIKNSKGAIATGEAEKRIYSQAITNIQKNMEDGLRQKIEKINKEQGTNISTDVSGFYENVNGRYNFTKKLTNAKLPSELKDYVDDGIKEMNDYLDKIEDIDEEKRKREKEIREMQKKHLSDMVNLQEEMRNTLKEKYQQEIDDLQEKYTAMEDADNDYIDSLSEAIEKQRKLREQSQEWDDLAKKEKKLSLLQRDTSGANQLETQKLEEEVQSDREKLLDNTIDNVIDGLKEIYELQKESRDAEIEYREALLSDGALMREVQEALEGINTADDLVKWFYENTANLSDMSTEQIKLEEDNWRELFDTKLTYMETSQADFNEALEVTEQNIADVMNNTFEDFTSESEKALNEVADTVNENIKSAKENLANAMDTLTDKIKEYNEAIKATKDAAEDLKRMIDSMALGAVTNGLTDGIQAGISTALSSMGNSNTNTGKRTTLWDSSWEAGPTGGTNNGFSLLGTNNGSTTKTNEVVIDKLDPNAVKLPFNPNSSEWKAWIELWNYGSISQEKIDSNTHLRQLFAENSEKNALNFLSSQGVHGWIIGRTLYKTAPHMGGQKQFKSGGLVNYTGPAWVDGSPNRPEAFLNSEDTRRIGEAAQLLANLPILNGTSATNNISASTYGDTIFEISVNVDSIASDYDLDEAIERVEQRIVEVANYTGSNVILRKR